jgi:quercetin 2,3-dioxygenase
MINITPNKDRYHFESDWLSTRWHFSFDHYYDPSNVSFGPLRVFNDDWVRPGSGFPTHGHREMEIITYVLEGELEHKDSTGGAGRITAGEVQRMSAGTGIRHSEYNPSSETPLHLLQIWIQPAIRGLDPSYEQLQFSETQREGKLLAVASGQGRPETVKIHQDTTIYVSSIGPENRVVHALGSGRRAYVFVIDGELLVNAHRLESGDQARIENESELSFVGSRTSEIMLIDLP